MRGSSSLGMSGPVLATVQRTLGLGDDELRTVELPDAYGPGSIVTVEIESDHLTEVFSGVGRRGVRAETVAADAANAAKRYLAATDVPVEWEIATDENSAR